MTKPITPEEPAHYRDRRPCDTCGGKERVRICSACYGRLLDRAPSGAAITPEEIAELRRLAARLDDVTEATVLRDDLYAVAEALPRLLDEVERLRADRDAEHRRWLKSGKIHDRETEELRAVQRRTVDGLLRFVRKAERERDEARAEVERLRADATAMREALRDYAFNDECEYGLDLADDCGEDCRAHNAIRAGGGYEAIDRVNGAVGR